MQLNLLNLVTMASVTLELSEQLKAKVEPFSRWLPAILEIGLLTLRTPVSEAASEFVGFLTRNPLPREVHGYRLPEPFEKRAEALLEQNRERALRPSEERELDEFLALEQVVRKLKAELSTDELVGT